MGAFERVEVPRIRPARRSASAASAGAGVRPARFRRAIAGGSPCPIDLPQRAAWSVECSAGGPQARRSRIHEPTISPSVSSPTAPCPSTASWKPRMSNARRARCRARRAAAGSPAGRSCRRGPGPARRCSDRPRSSTLFAARARVLEHEVDRLLAGPAERVHARCRRRAGRRARRRTRARRSGRGRRCRGPSRRPGARCRGPSPRRRRSDRRGAGTPGRPVSSWRDRELEVVAGNGLVEGERLGLVARPGLGLRRC